MRPDKEISLTMRMLVGDYDPDQPRDENGRWLDVLSGVDTEYVEAKGTAVLGGWGMRKAVADYLKRQGVSEETVLELDRLVDGHRNGGAAQFEADAALVSHLAAGDELGIALKHRADFEEALYKRWRRKHRNSSQLRDGELKLYRKGLRKSGVESWTVNEEGADFGHGGIGYDHETTLESLLRDGYRVLGGFGTMTGGPGEAEITVIKE